ncbi:MAG: nucleotide-binding protein [Dehalococcoidia bacterium]|nr:nucleotide-binding protein [Dehalococcoidia bacterium]
MAICTYLATKPIGATLTETKAVVANKYLDGRKLTALKFWVIAEEDSGKLKITERGRRIVKESAASRIEAMREIVRDVKPYTAFVEKVVHRHESTATATDVAAHWHDHFKDAVSDSEKILKDQAICFFHVAQEVDLGTLVFGRKGLSTRFDFDNDKSSRFISMQPSNEQQAALEAVESEEEDWPSQVNDQEEGGINKSAAADSNQVFITHGANEKILSQLKELVTYGRFEPVVAMEHETSAKPVPQKVMSAMRTCRAAVIHVGTDKVLSDQAGNEVPQINANVLIEIGAAMALYGDKFILLVEEGLELPFNLQGLYECRYQGDELNMPAIMKLLKAFNEF